LHDLSVELVKEGGKRNSPGISGLSAEAEPGDQRTVSSDVFSGQVVEEASSLTYQFQESGA
jgi:hypothetical protein